MTENGNAAVAVGQLRPHADILVDIVLVDDLDYRVGERQGRRLCSGKPVIQVGELRPVNR